MSNVNTTPETAPKLRSGFKVKSPTRGGARPGAGRKKGSTPKYSLDELMTQIQRHTGMPYAEQVAVNYASAIERKDYAGVRDYDRVLLGKLVADKQEIITTESEDATAQKAAAFADALKNIASQRDRAT